MSEKEAYDLIAQGNKKATQSGFFTWPKRDEAADLYTRAANQFKMLKRWKEAGDAYMKVAEMQILLNERDEAAMTYINASKAFKKSSPQDAVDALRMAVEILAENGRFHQAAGQMKEIAQLYESELVNLEQAMRAYETAADWYAGEDATSLANGCLIKVATFAAQLEQYDKAIQTFEQVATASLENSLTKWSVKEYFLQAGLCHLCNGDPVAVERALERYGDMDVTFSTTRECKFLKELHGAVEEGDVEAFTNTVATYDSLTKLDAWKTTLLLRVKKAIGEELALT
jgi:alpha-soluble NSF attachment protein